MRRPRWTAAAGSGNVKPGGVADCLDLGAAARWQLGADGVAEVRDEGGGIVVAVRLGQGCEAGDVGEDERRFDGTSISSSSNGFCT